MFCREVVAWKCLQHPNILPFLGVTVSEQQFVMPSEWVVEMDGENIDQFFKKHHHPNRLMLVCHLSNLYGELANVV